MSSGGCKRRWPSRTARWSNGIAAAPQGSAISPVLANLFLHYAFDAWMRRVFPSVSFERYADDAIVHCTSLAHAEQVQKAIGKRLSACGLLLHPDKTRIVYCKDNARRGSHEHESFDFLGYTFRACKARDKNGTFFTSFLPAVSNTAAKAKRQEIRRWRLHLWTAKSPRDIATAINPIVRGGINYYGRFYRSRLSTTVSPNRRTSRGRNRRQVDP